VERGRGARQEIKRGDVNRPLVPSSLAYTSFLRLARPQPAPAGRVRRKDTDRCLLAKETFASLACWLR
jgi:hypothetical protein